MGANVFATQREAVSLIDLLVFGKNCSSSRTLPLDFDPWEQVFFLDETHLLPLYTIWRVFVNRARTL